MADDDEINLDDGGVSSSSADKKSFGSILLKFLKPIGIALAAIIVIVVVVSITVKNIMNNTSATSGQIQTSEEYASGQREIYDWYTSLGLIQTTTMDDPPATVRIDIAFGYKKDDKATSTEITQRTVELKSFLRRFFNGKTAYDLRAANEDAILNEIKNGINDRILSGSKIRAVEFQQKDVIEQNY